MNPPLIQAIHDGLSAFALLATGAALAEIWRWALRSDVGPYRAIAQVAQRDYPETIGFVCRTLGITQVDDSE
jgi:hypothetical protein